MLDQHKNSSLVKKSDTDFRTIEHWLRQAVGLSVPQFLAVFLLYGVASSLFLISLGVPTLQAAGLAFVTGVIFSAAFVSACRLAYQEAQESARNFLAEQSYHPENGEATEDKRAPAPSHSSSEAGSQEKLRRARRIEALKRDAAKMHDKLFRTGAIIAVSLVVFWFLMDRSFGLSPEEVYFFPWYLIALFWFFMIVFSPSWLTYPTFFGLAGFRFAVEVFGPQLILFLPNFLMLPFFYFFMMIFMFGSIMLPNLAQLKFFRPGDATWETPKGSMRGQPEARAIVETEMRKFEAWAAGRSNRRATRGMIFDGPPGTGKTLYAKELATEHDLPFIFADAQALMPPFFGFGPLILSMYFRPRTEALAEEYGGAIVFIDEAETVLAVRSGMPGPGIGAGPGQEVQTVWDVLSYDPAGCISSCGLMFDTEAVRERSWPLRMQDAYSGASAGPRQYTHPLILPMGGGIGNASIFSLLTWLDGADTPPFKTKLIRGKINDFLNALFIPVTLFGKILRLPPGKPRSPNLLFIAATNRAWLIDPAMRRPGRFGVRVPFRTPSPESRKDIADRYFAEAIKKNWLHPDLYTEEKLWEFARATPGMSPAEIEAAIKQAADVRLHHVETLKRIKEQIDSGVEEKDLLEQDRKFWLRHKDSIGKPGWDDLRADWASLMEARMQVLHGKAEPSKTSEAYRKTTAYHEFMGHLVPLKAFLGEQMRPTVLSVVPRGSALGMVAHVPIEERDPMPQAFYEGLIRVSIGSTIAERFFFNENLPGVSSDLENATRVACFMVGKCAMTPYRCSEQEWKRYLKIGESLLVVPDSSPAAVMGTQTFVELVLRNPSARERVCVILGQAAVDVYRLIRENAHLAREVVSELLEVDEFSGKRLEDLWDRLGNDLITFPRMAKTAIEIWPDRHFAPGNPFYTPQKPEAEQVLAERRE